MSRYFESPISLPYVPDHLSVVQFMLDYQHDIRPLRGNVPCLIDSCNSKSFGLDELRQRTSGLAKSLQKKYKLAKDDRVMIVSPNNIDYPVVIWAVHRIGGIVTCSNPHFTAEELGYQIKICKPSLIIVHSDNLEATLIASRLAGIPTHRMMLMDNPDHPEFAETFSTVASAISEGLCSEELLMEHKLRPGEGRTKVALLSWSSGTTGQPKAVAISHYGFIANIIQMATHNRLGKSELHGTGHPSSCVGDIALGVLPFYHVAGLVIGLHLSVFSAMTLVVVPKYDFWGMLDLIHRYRISHLLLVPPHAIAFSKNHLVSNYSFFHVKSVVIGAAPLPTDIQQCLFHIFPNAQIGQAYGLTEMTTTLSMVSPLQKQGPPGSGGRLLPGIKARVLRFDGSLAGCGEAGELFVKGPAAALGYYNDEESTQETFMNGWVRTGDKVAITEANEVYVFDRVKELLKVNGFQVAPAELEGCLLGHPFVLDACVVGIPDPRYGEIPRAYVVLSADLVEWSKADEASSISEVIEKYVASRKAGYKHLRGGIRFVESIPKSASGKILRRVFRDLECSARSTSHSEETFVRAKL